MEERQHPSIAKFSFGKWAFQNVSPDCYMLMFFSWWTFSSTYALSFLLMFCIRILVFFCWMGSEDLDYRFAVLKCHRLSPLESKSVSKCRIFNHLTCNSLDCSRNITKKRTCGFLDTSAGFLLVWFRSRFLCPQDAFFFGYAHCHANSACRAARWFHDSWWISRENVSTVVQSGPTTNKRP